MRKFLEHIYYESPTIVYATSRIHEDNFTWYIKSPVIKFVIEKVILTLVTFWDTATLTGTAGGLPYGRFTLYHPTSLISSNIIASIPGGDSPGTRWVNPYINLIPEDITILNWEICDQGYGNPLNFEWLVRIRPETNILNWYYNMDVSFYGHY